MMPIGYNNCECSTLHHVFICATATRDQDMFERQLPQVRNVTQREPLRRTPRQNVQILTKSHLHMYGLFFVMQNPFYFLEWQLARVDEVAELWLDGNTMDDVVEDDVLDNEAVELRTELELEATITTAELLTEDDANELLTDDEDTGVVGVEPPPPPPPPQAVSTKAKLQVAQVLVIKPNCPEVPSSH